MDSTRYPITQETIVLALNPGKAGSKKGIYHEEKANENETGLDILPDYYEKSMAKEHLKYKAIIIQLLQGRSQREIAQMNSVSLRAVSWCSKAIKNESITLENIESFNDDRLKEIVSPKEARNHGKAAPAPAKSHPGLMADSSRAGTPGTVSDGCLQPGSLMFAYWMPRTSYIDENGEPQAIYVFLAILPYSQAVYLDYSFERNIYSWTEEHNKAFASFGGTPSRICAEGGGKSVFITTYNAALPKRLYRYQLGYYNISLADRDSIPETIIEKASSIYKQVKQALENTKNLPFDEFRQTIKDLANEINNTLCKPGFSRKKIFLSYERKALAPITGMFEIFEIKENVIAGKDGHVSYKNNRYSIPASFYKDLNYYHRLTLHIYNTRIEIYCGDELLAVHGRIYSKHRTYSTNSEHIPDGNESLPYSSEYFLKWSRTYGNDAERLIRWILSSRKYEQQAYYTCTSILSLIKYYPYELVNKVCADYIESGIRQSAFRYLQTTLAKEDPESARRMEELKANPEDKQWPYMMPCKASHKPIHCKSPELTDPVMDPLPTN